MVAFLERHPERARADAPFAFRTGFDANLIKLQAPQLQSVKLVSKLETDAPDRDSARLGELGRLSMQADQLHREAEARRQLRTRAYRNRQKAVYQKAMQLVLADKRWTTRHEIVQLAEPAQALSA